MGYRIVHAHGDAGPRGKRSYMVLGGIFKTKQKAAVYVRKNLRGGNYKLVPTSRLKRTKYKGLYYIV